ncbi:hypothetical protein HOO54_06875 [Bacillus sp. WMMC1349]|uniref:hypothetical protein n=1 Tax=Bacillus sp. WMMC1349 TaxID=2736254 RepID=UPI0015535F4C|nr:hypothetical protein [Bacillus sp. WMMC1349]NPC91941.1 hypothetical protein [Bacillus sp. WMMC1349]
MDSFKKTNSLDLLGRANQLDLKDDPLLLRHNQRNMLRIAMRTTATTKLTDVQTKLKPKFKTDNMHKEMITVYSTLLCSFTGKAQEVLAQRISASAQQLVEMEKTGESFVGSFKPN